VVGVNKYTVEEEIPVEVLEIDEELESLQIEKTNRVKTERDNKRVAECLERVGDACSGEQNIMEFLIEAVKADATSRRYVTFTERYMENTEILGSIRIMI